MEKGLAEPTKTDHVCTSCPRNTTPMWKWIYMFTCTRKLTVVKRNQKSPKCPPTVEWIHYISIYFNYIFPWKYETENKHVEAETYLILIESSQTHKKMHTAPFVLKVQYQATLTYTVKSQARGHLCRGGLWLQGGAKGSLRCR